jgi:hypothetical protein
LITWSLLVAVVVVLITLSTWAAAVLAVIARRQVFQLQQVLRLVSQWVLVVVTLEMALIARFLVSHQMAAVLAVIY